VYSKEEYYQDIKHINCLNARDNILNGDDILNAGDILNAEGDILIFKF